MEEFEPRIFQKEMLDKITSTPREALLQLPPHHTHYGIDMAEEGGDHTVISRVKFNSRGKIVSIVFDEYSTMPNYKWYRNPIKLLKWKFLWRKIGRQTKKRGRGWNS